MAGSYPAWIRMNSFCVVDVGSLIFELLSVKPPEILSRATKGKQQSSTERK